MFASAESCVVLHIYCDVPLFVVREEGGASLHPVDGSRFIAVRLHLHIVAYKLLYFL